MPHRNAEGLFCSPTPDTSGLDAATAARILRSALVQSHFTETTYACDVCAGPVPKSGPELTWIAGQEAAHADECPPIKRDDPRAAIAYLLSAAQRLEAAEKAVEHELAVAEGATPWVRGLIRALLNSVMDAIQGRSS